jgi:hypothetical protein
MSLLATLATAVVLSGRVAIVVSSADAHGQAPLRYAERDADRMAEVLRELGGFSQVWVLHQPTAGALESALDRAERLAASDPGLEILMFYSGHADHQGVLLRGERLAYQRLRDRLSRSPAAVRVLMLDACNSGAAVRTKGGRPSAGFAMEAVSPGAPASGALTVSGAAILTASTASELAQESSDIEGSYFTHHLLSGLRGAADRDGNGQVTLGEIYQYAASHTVAATVPSLWGPQHPAYEYRLSGTGDLILTRLQLGSSALTFPAGETEARYFVTTTRHQVVAEVALHRDRRVRLALAPGRYRVVRRQEDPLHGRQAFVAEVALAPSAETRIETASFRETAPELALAKGRGSQLRNEVELQLGLSGLGPGVLGNATEVGLGWMRRVHGWSLGGQLGVGRSAGALGGIDYRLLRWTASAVGLRRIALPLVELQLGASGGASAIQQSLAGQAYTGVAPVLLGIGALDVPLRDWLSVRTTWGLGVELLKLNGSYRVVPEARAALGTLVRF